MPANPLPHGGTPPERRLCDNCGKPLALPSQVQGKRFCGSLEGDLRGACRSEWHARRRRLALAKLTEEEKASG